MNWNLFFISSPFNAQYISPVDKFVITPSVIELSLSSVANANDEHEKWHK